MQRRRGMATWRHGDMEAWRHGGMYTHLDTMDMAGVLYLPVYAPICRCLHVAYILPGLRPTLPTKSDGSEERKGSDSNIGCMP